MALSAWQAEEARWQLRAVVEATPGLTAYGFGVYGERQLSLEETKEKFVKAQASLLDMVEQFVKTCEWITRTLTARATINTRHTSYGLKHIAEREVGYITNGLFIAAAIHCKFRYEPDGPNAYFNVSSRSVNAAVKAIEARAYREASHADAAE